MLLLFVCFFFCSILSRFYETSYISKKRIFMRVKDYFDEVIEHKNILFYGIINAYKSGLSIMIIYSFGTGLLRSLCRKRLTKGCGFFLQATDFALNSRLAEQSDFFSTVKLIWTRNCVWYITESEWLQSLINRSDEARIDDIDFI